MCTLCMVQMVSARFIENSSLIGNEVKQGDLDTGIEVSKKEVSSIQLKTFKGSFYSSQKHFLFDNPKL